MRKYFSGKEVSLMERLDSKDVLAEDEDFMPAEDEDEDEDEDDEDE